MLCSKCKKHPVERFKKKCVKCLRKNSQAVYIYQQKNKEKIASHRKKREVKYIKNGECRFCRVKLDSEIDSSDRCFNCRQER